jgi:hypothetical protein
MYADHIGFLWGDFPGQTGKFARSSFGQFAEELSPSSKPTMRLQGEDSAVLAAEAS